jgi:formylglycine-generating enzyme required for sulfatase activity
MHHKISCRFNSLFSTILLILILVPAISSADAPIAHKTADDRRVKVVASSPTESRRRIALVIGNSAYIAYPLKNPANDAHVMAKTLRHLGFEVEEKVDLNYVAMNEAVEQFGHQLKAGGVGLFYYAGHGMQVQGSNYLIPVDARINSENEVRYKAVDAGLVLSFMELARNDVNIVIMDACRDNPFSTKGRGGPHGLTTMEAPSGTIIAYATAPGKTASDGDGRDNGLYTAELVQVMETPGLKVEDVFKRVLKGVREKSDNAQIPWVATSFEGDFYFTSPVGSTEPKPDPPPSTPVPQPPVHHGFTDPTLGLDFVDIKGGCFQMGDTFGDGPVNEKPTHEVCIDDFALEKYDVTVGEFRKFAAATGYQTKAENDGCTVLNGKEWKLDPSRNWQNPGFTQDDRHPVVCVSWNDVQAFIRWLSKESGRQYRLPTEAEWEYAARSRGKKEKFAGTSDNGSLSRYANFCDANCDLDWKSTSHNDGYRNSSPVGRFLPNELGLYDMSGNVWQWCFDWYGDTYYRNSPNNNPQGPSEGDNDERVYRGGGWRNQPSDVRVSNRNGLDPSSSSSNVGFRLASPSVR